LVSHAGSALLVQVAGRSGLTRALSRELAGLKQRRAGHDQGRVAGDLAVMLADGGDCLSDLCALGDQASLFGDVASASTAFRLVDRIASDPAGLERLRGAHAAARAHGLLCPPAGPVAPFVSQKGSEHQLQGRGPGVASDVLSGDT
jgi:hypothetical protein